jgi:TetR/AcrR family transcriptional regulator, mexCD-oprJ operon repressor
MPEPAVDHRRATAQRNAAAILDAAERLMARGAALSVAGVAAEAGVSRPTLYAHYATLGDVVESAVDRAIAASLAAVEAADPEAGPADEALVRMVRVAWGELARQDGLGRAAAEHLSARRLNRAHAPLMARLRGLVDRGQADGTLRDDLPADWLVTAFFALVHAAADHVREHGVARAAAGEMLERTVADLFAAR